MVIKPLSTTFMIQQDIKHLFKAYCSLLELDRNMIINQLLKQFLWNELDSIKDLYANYDDESIVDDIENHLKKLSTYQGKLINRSKAIKDLLK